MYHKTIIAFAAWALLAPGAPPMAQTITVGVTGTMNDAPIYIADKKGYFGDEGLDVNITTFRSAANMVVPLGTGQIQAGAGSASAALYNALARGIRIKIVADKASSAPGYGATKILVRKDHIESGRYRAPGDVKGMRVAMNAPGVGNTVTLNALLKARSPFHAGPAIVVRCGDLKQTTAKARRPRDGRRRRSAAIANRADEAMRRASALGRHLAAVTVLARDRRADHVGGAYFHGKNRKGTKSRDGDRVPSDGTHPAPSS